MAEPCRCTYRQVARAVLRTYHFARNMATSHAAWYLFCEYLADVDLAAHRVLGSHRARRILSEDGVIEVHSRAEYSAVWRDMERLGRHLYTWGFWPPYAYFIQWRPPAHKR